MNKMSSIVVSPFPPRYPVPNVGYLQVNAQDKLLVIYDDKGNAKVVSASDSSITSGVINQLIDIKLKDIKVLKYKGIKETYEDLLAEQDKEVGDVWQVRASKKEYVWNGSDWIEIGFDFNLDEVYKTIAATSGILQNVKADKSTTISGYNISDAYTKVETENLINNTSSVLENEKADKANTISGYNINDAYTKIETENLINNVSSVLENEKADKANTISGYNINDAYTINQIDSLLNNKQNIITNNNKLNYTLLSGFDLYLSGHVNDPVTGQICYFHVNGLSTLFYGTTDKISTKDVLKVNIGIGNTVSGLLSYAHGKGNSAIGRYSVAEGYGTNTIGDASYSQGMQTQAIGNYSHAEGAKTIATGSTSHAEGQQTNSIGAYSHAEGNNTSAFIEYSHAQGGSTAASGTSSHAEGLGAVAVGKAAHAEGHSTIASGQASHTEGQGTKTYSNYSHAEGRYTTATGNYSHAEGNYTVTSEDYQHVEGQWNIPLTGYQHIVGGGQSGANKNIQTLDWSGNEWNAGTVTASDFIFNNTKLSDINQTVNTISSTYLKNINLNGSPGTVQNNIATVSLPTCNPFPSSFLDGIYHGSNVTTQQFCASICNTSTAVVGMVYLGGVSLTDMPFIGNAEVIVRIMTSSKVIVLQMFSTNIPCNHWYAMYFSGMQTGTSDCPWQGIMSINGSNKTGYAPISDYQAASKKYVDSKAAAVSSYVKELNETKALVNALSGLLVSKNVITTTELNTIVDQTSQLTYNQIDDLL